MLADDYFLSNVKAVDEITEDKKLKLLSTTNWSDNLVQALTIWPCVNILYDVPASDFKGKICAGCSHSKLHARILLYGQPYNLTTLEGSPIDPKVPQDKVRMIHFFVFQIFDTCLTENGQFFRTLYFVELVKRKLIGSIKLHIKNT